MAVYLIEGTKYDKQAAKILSDSGLFSEEVATNVIQALFREDIHAFVHSPAWLEKYLKGIARMIVEEANGSQEKAQEFLTDSIATFEQYLTWVKENRDKQGGTKLDDEFNNKMHYRDVVDFLQKVQDELDKQSKDELANMTFNTSNYELVPINSFDEFHSLFGGRATGDGSSDKYAGGGGTAWCHANSSGTYDNWVNRGKFFVLANRNWKDIPFDKKSNDENPKDAYGNSLIALLVDPNTGKLLNATLRCNHVGVNSNADNQYKTYSELSSIAGFNVENAVMADLEKEGTIVDVGNIKELWYKYFNGTEKSVKKICGILGVEKNALVEAYIPNGVTNIDSYAFYKCTSLASIEIPNSVKSIGMYAFEHCTSLTSIEIPNSVKSIGYSAFSGCTGLTSITIPDSVTSIGYGAFSDCTGLTSITIPDSVTIIGTMAFYGCTGLTSLEIPNGVTSTGDLAFSGCTGLTSITIPDSVTRIAEGMFKSCTSLKSIEIPNSITGIGSHSFEDCIGLKSINIPNSVTYIGFYTFKNCTGLTDINIPNSVTILEKVAFQGCTNLTIHTKNQYVIYYCKENGIPYDTNVNESYKRVYKGDSRVAVNKINESNTQFLYPFKMQGVYESGNTLEVGGNSEQECVERLAARQDSYGALLYYTGVTDENYESGELITLSEALREDVTDNTSTKGHWFYNVNDVDKYEPNWRESGEYWTDKLIRKVRIYPATDDLVDRFNADTDGAGFPNLWPIWEIGSPSWEFAYCKDKNAAYEQLKNTLNQDIYEAIHDL